MGSNIHYIENAAQGFEYLLEFQYINFILFSKMFKTCSVYHNINIYIIKTFQKASVSSNLNSAALLQKISGDFFFPGGDEGMKDAARIIDENRRAGSCTETDNIHIIPAYQLVIES